MWCKYSRKKHKTYNDGVLVIKEGKICILKDMQAKEIGKTSSYPAKELVDLGPGNSLCFSGKELEILDEITPENYQSGSVFLDEVEAKGGVAPAPTPKLKIPTKFKSHAVGDGKPTVKEIKPRHAINEDSVVLFNPTAASDPNGPLTAVVVDPYVGNILQPHQREGVKFLYECTMGLKGPGRGCILADEMGLGKTLQAITLIWTLLKQGPNGTPASKKALVITPTSLTKNWYHEVKRWLGLERLHALVIGQAASKKEETLKVLDEFKTSPHRPLLIISYEQFRIHATFLQGVAGIDLVICDEGHRLKNADARITKCINGLETRRRVIITGTPIQNDLEEFFTMVNFCNPGFMDLKKFRDVFATPIVLGRDPNATPQQKLESQSRSTALMKRTESFIIRRTKDLLRQYLPPRVEQVVFCRLSSLQADLYRQYLRSTMAAALSCIISLRKLCNHPCAIFPKPEVITLLKLQMVEAEPEMKKVAALFPEDFTATTHDIELSGKMEALDKLLGVIRTTTKDRVVIVSNFKQSLDVMQTLCKKRSYRFVRLDGSTPTGQRQNIVDHFNDQTSDYSGNVGFNLVGSNRIVLFDPDWNPANDAQAMGRVWRYGQKKKCWIYRFASTGTIEEKIFQRQVAKEGLSNAIMDASRMAGDALKVPPRTQYLAARRCRWSDPPFPITGTLHEGGASRHLLIQ
ncbi:DNA repair and recombination protein RAD54B, putative [Acanthamoeba castellanii str. Neff]|uniref:DNA repair and recombination protein RAD54B, putative n=1 Tax=Acanthamoeba castellanii (strain ATCC 30010 / Neff) TaxID=1257118 RepID=L8GQK0_ACACF|nr:DNA repair and recombination protein RAD54B, putative [Acanthamoeba castellanii str. Neff]ELR14933.1 DNA repair and recombination protein RAD54B, putative [Acanthamoeba castellanii str. Neff]